MAAKREAIILNYHDTLIHESDMELLEGPYWLNDTIIGFYLEYLEEELYRNTDVCFVRPEVTQCLKLSEVSEYSALLDPLNFKNKSFAILPLNDCESANSPGGSHWSLLVYSRPELSFYHIDSSKGSNYYAAKILSNKLSEYLNITYSADFKVLNSLQQLNSYDCGVFVLCNIDNIMSYIIENKNLSSVNPIKEYHVLRKRHEIKSIIRSLAKLK